MSSSGFSIGELSEQTGVKTVTLRAWERRHGILKPSRSNSGHRIYSASDVSRVREVVGWLQQGVAIGQVPGLLRGHVGSKGDHSDIVAELVDAALRFGEQKLDQLLGRCMGEQPLALFVRDTLYPARRQLRDIGGESAVGLALLDGVLQHKLGAQVLKYSRRVRRQAAWLVVAAGAHESRLTAVLYALALLEAGAEALYLPRVVSGTALQAMMSGQRAGQLLLVACPGTRASDWRRLVPSGDDPQGSWLVSGNAASLSLPGYLEELVGEPWDVIQDLAGEVGQ